MQAAGIACSSVARGRSWLAFAFRVDRHHLGSTAPALKACAEAGHCTSSVIVAELTFVNL